MLKKGSYIPWASRFLRYIDGKKDYGKMLEDSIYNGPYKMKPIMDPRNTTGDPIVKPYPRLKKEEDLTGDDKKRFKADIDAMNAILLGIPNDIYNFVDACKTPQTMWQRMRRLMHGTDISKQEMTSRLIDEHLDDIWKILAMPSNLQRDGVRNFEMASGLNRHSETLEDSAKRRREVWEQNRVLAGFGIGGKKEKVYTSWVVTEGDLATRAIETPLSSPMGTMWCLCDPTPSDWERTRLRLFQFFLRDQASNWLERLPARSISTWEDLTTRFLAQFFPPGRTSKLRNDILMFQQHQVSLPQDVPSTSDHRLIKLENQVQRLMEAHLAPKSRVQVNKIDSSCEICSGPHDAQYCMENPEQAFVDYTSSLKTLTVNKIGTPKLKEPEQTLEDEFKDLHLNLPVLEVLAHALMYNAILDKYVESLELGKNGFVFIQGEMLEKLKDPGLFTLPCRLEDSKPFDTLAYLGSCVNLIPSYLFKKLNIGVLEEADHVFGLADGTKSYSVGIFKNIEVHIGRLKLLKDFYVIDMEKDPVTPLLVGRGFLATASAVIDCRKAKIAVGEGVTRIYLMRRRPGVLRSFMWMILGLGFSRGAYATSGGGLILYQAYGNLYAMTGRKAHLLEDKQILIVGVFDEIMNDLERHEALPNIIATNTKFLNSLQPEWSKQNENNVNVLRAKRASRTRDPPTLVANYYATPSSSHTSPAYYVTHPPFVSDFGGDTQSYEFHRDAISDNLTDSLTTAMMFLAKAITQHYSTQTNNRLRASSDTRNQDYGQDGRIDVQSKNVTGNSDTVERILRTSENAKDMSMVKCYNCNEKGHLANVCPKPRVRDSNYFKEQMLLAKKDEAGIALTKEENDFLLTDVNDEEKLEELNASCIMMVRIQIVNNDFNAKSTCYFDFTNEVHDSSSSFMNDVFSKSNHEQKYHEQPETIKPTYDGDQIDSDIIFDDQYVKDNSENVKHCAHNQKYAEFELLMRNVQLEAEKTKEELKSVKDSSALLTTELAKCFDCVFALLVCLPACLLAFSPYVLCVSRAFVLSRSLFLNFSQMHNYTGWRSI
ncbi:MAK10-like protein [Tanacetum coccineum]|uniref:MAK10-like protein n=1 Tax=Tanacetum coccineum TaxID=301880 RepID=A0ABQ5DZ65_9ASTR